MTLPAGLGRSSGSFRDSAQPGQSMGLGGSAELRSRLLDAGLVPAFAFPPFRNQCVVATVRVERGAHAPHLYAMR